MLNYLVMNSIIKNKKTYYVLGILFVFVSWEILSVISNNNFVVPSIELTFTALGKILIDKETYFILGSTLLRLLISISLCFVLGVVLAVLSNLSNSFKSFIKPMVVLLKTLPMAAVIIMLLVMVGRSYSPYFIIGVVVFPLIYEATLHGLEGIDKDIKDEVKLLSENNFQVFRSIYIPLTLPHILTSLIQSVGLGLKVLVMAEFIAETKNSIGEAIRFYKNEATTEYVFAWSIILILFVLLVDSIINNLKKRSLA